MAQSVVDTSADEPGFEHSCRQDFVGPLPETGRIGRLHGDLVHEGHHAGERLTAVGRIDAAETSPPSVLVGALGPAMLRVAGELADGTVTPGSDRPYWTSTWFRP